MCQRRSPSLPPPVGDRQNSFVLRPLQLDGQALEGLPLHGGDFVFRVGLHAFGQPTMPLPPRTMAIHRTREERWAWEWFAAKRGLTAHAYAMRAIRLQAERDRREFGDPPAPAAVRAKDECE